MGGESIKAFTLPSKERMEERERDREWRRVEIMNKKSWQREEEGKGGREKEREGQIPEHSDAGKEGTGGRARRPSLISLDGFAITVQIIIPLSSASIDMSLRIYILRGYDLETDTVDLPFPSNPAELTQAKQDREVGDTEETEREKWKRGRERERDNPKRVFMQQKNIDRSRTCIYVCARTRHRF